jgi:type 1 fimbria pilin
MKILMLPLVGWLVFSPQASANMNFSGELAAEACTIVPGDEDISVDFDEISAQDLYSQQRTPGKSFRVRLQDCDLNVANSVTITFRGTQNSALPGLLALDSSSTASGIAIGLETPQSQPLPLNQASTPLLLNNGNYTINLLAYIQAEPDAIANRDIIPGNYSAVATFMLDYQ